MTIGVKKDTSAIAYNAINLHSDIAKTLPPRLKLPYKLSVEK